MIRGAELERTEYGLAPRGEARRIHRWQLECHQAILTPSLPHQGRIIPRRRWLAWGGVPGGPWESALTAVPATRAWSVLQAQAARVNGGLVWPPGAYGPAGRPKA